MLGMTSGPALVLAAASVAGVFPASPVGGVFYCIVYLKKAALN
jgi:hypothetical protein